MSTLGLSTQYKVRQCSQCQEDTEFYCNTCKHDLCLQCKEEHVAEKSTKYHSVVFYVTRHTQRNFTTQCKVRQCSQCQGDTEFYCNTCKRDLCLQCKEKHVIDLHTKYHDVVIYREKFKCVPLRETCVRHTNRKYRKFCDQCKYSVCKRCIEHRTHALKSLRTTYRTKRQQHREIIHTIRSDTIYNCRVFLAGIKNDIKTCPQLICYRQLQMSTKAQRLKDMIDTVVCNVKTRCRGVLTERMQKRKMNRDVVHIENYEHSYEQSANRAVQFLLFIKTSRVPQIKNSPSRLLSVITEIQMTTQKRQIGINECVKRMPTPIKHMSICVKGISYGVYHISRVRADRVWVCDSTNLILTDTTGDTVHCVADSISGYRGIHTVKSSHELIYINSADTIKVLSVDNKTDTDVLNKTLEWTTRCVYYSPAIGDLIVGMCKSGAYTGRVTRYTSTGQHILTIEHDNEGHMLYSYPDYITENKNGDIIVSDYDRRAVVVTERVGRHRFSYTGPPSGSSLRPCGICTDALSHILVCDLNTHTVQMIDKDGQFLFLLLTRQHGIYRPFSLDYDDKTNLLWVGSQGTTTVSVYRYIQRRYSLTDNQESANKGTREESDPDDKEALEESDFDDEDTWKESDPGDMDIKKESLTNSQRCTVIIVIIIIIHFFSGVLLILFKG
ncbi:E3 ubiquitin-protein ligase TRIM71-like [Ostrea edulis]|uniref:E3 ubiquitin-protein ligase TRIM71-like n=1 Tax=Ostrea edulis TaxID=37623 RepID=UPI0024AE9552|nr:E3 ubiquitin-protein ligase TRIM71-like [Ostrea edulis]XP_056005805.1 E3 ubiquitin-protein ligase TRIM71-like [Ostrea edulis]